LWIGFDRGGLVNFRDGQIRASYAVTEGLGNGRVNQLRFDEAGALWAATEGGLSRLDQGRMGTLTTRNGLPCDGVHWSIEDDAASVWLSMPCGLVSIPSSELRAWAANPEEAAGRPRRVRSAIFDGSDGVASRARTFGYSPRVAKSRDGRIWYTSQDGASVVDPRWLPFNRLPPPVYVQQLVADGTPHETASTAVPRVLRLPALTRDLQIDYTALSLVAAEKVRFRYKLEGYDRDWHEAGNRRQAFYTNLPPRAYRFRLTASNNSGVWNEAGAVLDFSVAPAYYQTAWFAGLSLAALAAILLGAHRVRLRIAEKHQHEISALNERLMMAQEQERIRIAGELHDGVMQDMLAVTMMLGTARRRIPDGSDARATIDKAQQKLVHLGTDLRQLSHDLHPPLLQDAGLSGAMRSYCEQFSATWAIPVACDADESVSELSRGASLALFRIVQEALGNAAKHAAATRIAVSLTRVDGQVSLVVSDDGVGFAPNRLAGGGGLGLVMMRERAGQLNGTFEYDSAPGRGTRIKVVVPFR
jgi:signal transduction histidine kinase